MHYLSFSRNMEDFKLAMEELSIKLKEKLYFLGKQYFHLIVETLVCLFTTHSDGNVPMKSQIIITNYNFENVNQILIAIT